MGERSSAAGERSSGSSWHHIASGDVETGGDGVGDSDRECAPAQRPARVSVEQHIGNEATAKYSCVSAASSESWGASASVAGAPSDWASGRGWRRTEAAAALAALEEWLAELRSAPSSSLHEEVKKHAKRGFNKIWARAVRSLPSDRESDLEADGQRRFDFSRINDSPPVFLGRIPRGEHDMLALQRAGVAAVVSLSEDWEIDEQEWTSNMVQRANMQWLRVPTPDFSAPTLLDLLVAVVFLLKFALRATAAERESPGLGVDPGGYGRAVYVHCNRGRSRSALVVICYLMARFGWQQGDAVEYVRAARAEITLGPAFSSFWARLHAFGEGLSSRMRRRLAVS